MRDACPIALSRTQRTDGFENQIRFRVSDWMACSPERGSKEYWIKWSRGEPSIANTPLPPLKPIFRRRITPIGQLAFRAASGLEEKNLTRFIFCSRNGEFDRTLGLLKALAAREPLSPAEFALSVPNALAGLLSIAWKNQAGHTTIAAGSDSFGYGMLESVNCLVTESDKEVLLLYFDCSLPGEYAELNVANESTLALALLLVPPKNDNGDLFLSCEPSRVEAGMMPVENQALDFLRFLIGGATEHVSKGGRIHWRWCRAT